jgi:hypothetical protein
MIYIEGKVGMEAGYKKRERCACKSQYLHLAQIHIKHPQNINAKKGTEEVKKRMKKGTHHKDETKEQQEEKQPSHTIT